MRKIILTMAGAAAAVGLGAPAAYADVTCEPGFCFNTNDPSETAITTSNFSVSPADAGPNYVGNITANIGSTVFVGTAANPVSFTDTFNFELFQTGLGGGSVTNIAAAFQDATDIDFTSVLVNGASATISKALGGVVELAFASGVVLTPGANTISITGLARGQGSYGGSISFTPTVVPAVPEMATWGMMILGFVGMGAAMRRRRNTTVTFGNNRAFA